LHVQTQGGLSIQGRFSCGHEIWIIVLSSMVTVAIATVAIAAFG
jgi:hypothetical protein